ncbi:VpsR-related response regulator [Aeromonas caviae]|uniref:VpsR-related response regulator n=1 Tax=Aeromonas caviae TaxID=648 RepID=UPI001F276030|nr:VpsR-related response regulator [Aeromonas caviae]
MTETALLLINSCAVLESLLEQGEWQVEQASSLVVAEKKLQEKDYPLVLVVIEHQQHEALYNLIAQHSGALWIGLIQRDCLASEALRNLLAACFHDFHTFPLDRDRLSHSLGHALGMARLIRRHRPRLQPQLRFIQGGERPHPPVARPDRAVAALPPARTGDGTERHGQGAGGPGAAL